MIELDKLTGKEIAERSKLWRDDPVLFIEEVIAQGRFKLTPYQREWAKLLKTKKRLSFMAFRSSGKSEFFFVCYPLWAAFTKQGWQGILISNSENQAKGLIRRIKSYVQSNPILKTAIPKANVDTWSKTMLTFTNGSIIMSKVYNDNTRGEHVDFIGLDEVGTYRDHNILKEAIMPMLTAKEGTMVCIGTPESEIDLLHKIENDNEFSSFYTDRYPAQGEEKGNLYELRYPTSEVKKGPGIMEVYRHGELADTYSNFTWSKEFLLKPLGDGDMLFPPGLIKRFLDPEASFVYKARTDCRYFFGVDLALSGDVKADYTVVTVIEKHLRDPKYRVVNIDRRRGMDYNLQKQLIIEMAQAYKPSKILIDKSNFGETFFQDLRSAGLMVEGYNFGGSSRTLLTQAKKELIIKLREEFDKEGILLNYNQADARNKINIDELMQELSKFAVVIDKMGSVKFQGKGSHDDMVISLALAVFAASTSMKGCFSVYRPARAHGGFSMIRKV